MTTSKQILWFSWIIFFLLIILKVMGYDVTNEATIVGGIVTSVTTGFYMWKSKCENREKIAFSVIEKTADKYGIEPTISLISEIVKE